MLRSILPPRVRGLAIASRRYGPLAIVGVIAIAALLVAAPTSSAYVSAYYDQSTYTSDLRSFVKAVDGSYTGVNAELSMNTGGTYASATQAQGIRAALLNARWAAKMLPAAEGLGTIGLYVGAFDVGWKIGRTVDTKWLHISELAASDLGTPTTTGHVRDTDPWEWAWNSSAQEWRLKVHSDMGASCGETDVFPSGWTGNLSDIYPWSTRSNCSDFLVDAYTSLSTVVGTIGTTTTVTCPSSFFGSSYSGWSGTCYRIVASKTTIDNYLASHVDAFRDWNYSTDTPTFATAAYDPGWSSQGFASQDAQDQAARDVLDSVDSSAPGMFVDHLLNASGTVADPLVDFTWLEAEPDETYAQYVSRLQSEGWRGTANVITLDDDNGDSEYVAGGVPCTSVVAGTLVAPSEVVTIYKNATTLGTGDPDPNSAACPGKLATSLTSNRCTFYKNRWATVIVGNESFYNDACNDAWAHFWANQDIFTEEGEITSTALSNEDVIPIVDGEELWDPLVIGPLSALDPDMTHWAKGRTTVDFEGDHPFEIHFYWHLPTNTVRFDLDFKIRFLGEVFTP